MAQVFKLTRNSVDINLQDSAAPSNGNPRIMPRTASDGGRGWIPNTATAVYGREPDPVQEVIPLVIRAVNHNDLATAKQKLDDYMMRAVEYDKDTTQQYPVYLVDQLTGETTGRQALVLEGRAKISDEPHGVTTGAAFSMAVDLALTRMPYWEAATRRAFPAATPAAAASVIYDYTADPGSGAHDIVGDTLARISFLGINPEGANDQFGRLWIGTRSANKHGTLANFKNIWELEDGTNGTDASDVVDATASGGDAVDISPGTATWLERVGITFDDVGATEADNFGTFLWLLRSKQVDGGSGGTWEIQLRWGYQDWNDDDFIRGPIVQNKDVTWDFLEMGIQKLPLRNLQSITTTDLSATAEGTLEIQVWARRTAGAANDDLVIDCLCPIPVDESWLVSKNRDATEAGDGTHTDYWLYGQGPHNRRQAVVLRTTTAPATTVRALGELWTDGLGLPIGDGRMVIVYQHRGSSVLADTIKVGEASSFYVERWLNLRGAE